MTNTSRCTASCGLPTCPTFVVKRIAFAKGITKFGSMSMTRFGRITPIAIELGVALGYDPRPLVVAVMFAASAAFSTPIGYQTNMLVFGPGGYRFTDYMRVGIPMNITLALVASLMIPMLWPL